MIQILRHFKIYLSTDYFRKKVKKVKIKLSKCQVQLQLLLCHKKKQHLDHIKVDSTSLYNL